MEPPKIEQWDEIQAILKDIEETANSLQTLKDRLDDVVSALGSDVADKELLIELVAYLYWMVPEVRSRSLAMAVTGDTNVHRLKRHLPAVTAGVQCDRCEEPLVFNSRNKLHQTINDLKNRQKRGFYWPEGYLLVCDSCRDEIFAERNVQYRQEEDARQNRLNQLRRMPYREYLLTPEWKERRQRHLKSAGYRCQVCNSDDKMLDVHHRTYERRGEELFKDLIVLCRTCHGIFHREGKLESQK